MQFSQLPFEPHPAVTQLMELSAEQVSQALILYRTKATLTIHFANFSLIINLYFDLKKKKKAIYLHWLRIHPQIITFSLYYEKTQTPLAVMGPVLK